MHFRSIGDVPLERIETIVSKSGWALREYDFFFEWSKEPSVDQLRGLIEKIDEAMALIGCMYTITTKNGD